MPSCLALWLTCGCPVVVLYCLVLWLSCLTVVMWLHCLVVFSLVLSCGCLVFWSGLGLGLGSCLVLSCFVLSCPALSCPALSFLVLCLSYFALFCLVSSRLFSVVLPCGYLCLSVVLSWLSSVLPYLFLFCPLILCFALFLTCLARRAHINTAGQACRACPITLPPARRLD
jgi:hypothetical protein